MRFIAWLISLPFRALGYIFVLLAMATGVHDMFASVQQDALVLTPLGQFWADWSPDTLNLLQAGIQRNLSPDIWENGVFYFLKLPGFMAMFILATLVLLIAQLIYRPR